ncbi:MAG: hypothetical protein HC923_05910 [Myxococcales bacterium]|nr:hypothetical protein [Myxococcales bacterium]
MSLRLNNKAAYIPPQCYVDTQDVPNGRVHNTCYTCHAQGRGPDFVNNSNRQKNYSFIPEQVKDNPWTNLLTNRLQKADAIRNSEIQDYVRQSNYFDDQDKIVLADKLADLPAEWDFDKDGAWDGYVPDCNFRFDPEGFDRAANDQYTGWRALAYYPFPTVHWPANGAMGDVMIRLPEAFRTKGGAFDAEVYRLNFAILEALHKREDVMIRSVDEGAYGVDLDGDGALGTATRVAYTWAQGGGMSYVGDAKALLEQGQTQLAAGLFPVGTELMCTVRYLDVAPDGSILMADRFKEVRYMKKARWLSYTELEAIADDRFPGPEHPERLGERALRKPRSRNRQSGRMAASGLHRGRPRRPSAPDLRGDRELRGLPWRRWRDHGQRVLLLAKARHRRLPRRLVPPLSEGPKRHQRAQSHVRRGRRAPLRILFLPHVRWRGG